MNQVFKEDEVTELKKSTSELKEAIISITAILNKHQRGTLYFGIKDDGTVIGQQISGKTLKAVSEAISTKIEPRIYPVVSNVKIENKDCILVEFEGNKPPYVADGRPYIRISDQDKQLSVDEVKKLLNETTNKNETWDSLISDKTIDDVNEDILKDYINKANKAQRIPFEYTNKKDVLNKLKIIDENDRLLNAGKVLFCDDSGVELQMAIFATTTKTTFIDIDRKSGSLFELIKQAQEYIRKNIKWPVNFESGSIERVEIPEIPLEAIGEAIINSFIHRDLKNPKSNEIAIYKDRIEIFNPGKFPKGYKLEDFIKGKGSIPKNPLIANILYLSKDIKKCGTGFRTITDVCAKADIKVKFEIKESGFMVIFYRKNDEELYDLTQKKCLNMLDFFYGTGDYTKEKYESEEELTIEDFEKYIAEKNK